MVETSRTSQGHCERSASPNPKGVLDVAFLSSSGSRWPSRFAGQRLGRTARQGSLPSGSVTATGCGFDVLIEPVNEQFTLMTFPEGLPVVQFLTGHSVVRLSSANASIMLNVSGPAFTTVNHDGSLQFSGPAPGCSSITGSPICLRSPG
jgi:hypothetical protein